MESSGVKSGSISIGIDMESVPRFKGLAHKEKFLSRVFTEGEIAYSFGRRAPHKHLAGRFAAKEACMKALGTGLSDGIRWKDIEVVDALDGGPGLNLSSAAKRRLAGRKAFLSITYSEELAVAFVAIV